MLSVHRGWGSKMAVSPNTPFESAAKSSRMTEYSRHVVVLPCFFCQQNHWLQSIVPLPQASRILLREQLVPCHRIQLNCFLRTERGRFLGA